MTDSPSISLLKNRKNQWGKFLLGGGLNFAITYVVYVILNTIMYFQFAFAIAYGVGIIWGYWFNTKFVFNAKISLAAFLRYPTVYVFQYFQSAIVLWVGVEMFQMNKNLVPIVATIISIPVTFTLSKLILVPKAKKAKSGVTN